MSQAKPLRVRKQALEVELALPGAVPRRVELFLAEHGAHGFSRQRVLELIEESEWFLPACDGTSSEWESFNVRAVVWIAMSRASAEADAAGEELYDHRKLVRVELDGSRPLEGEILYSAPDGFARVVDVMNRRDRFLRLWSGDLVYLVNKNSVLRVVEATVSGG